MGVCFLILKILVAVVLISAGAIVIISVTDWLIELCKCMIVDCSSTSNKSKIMLSENLIMFFWVLAVSIVGGGGLFISRHNEKMEKLRKKTFDTKLEIIEKIQHSHPSIFAKLTSFNLIDCKNLCDDIRDDPEIKANLQFLCRNIIDVIKLRFSEKYGNVEFHCLKELGYESINKIDDYDEKGKDEKEKTKEINSEHKNGGAVDIGISFDCCKPPVTLNKLFQFITEENYCRDLPLNKVVLVNLDGKQWIHISSSRKGENKREFATLDNGEYTEVPSAICKQKK